MLPPLIDANTRTQILSAQRLSEIWPWCFASGIILVCFLPGLYLYAWCTTSLLLIFGLFHYRSRAISAAILMLCLGAIFGSLSGQQILDRHLRADIIKQDVLAEGVISGRVKRGSRSQRFEFNILSLQYRDTQPDYRGKVQLNCYRHCPEFRSGQRWQMTLRLKPAHGTLNPGGFNYAQWLFSQGIRATGYVRQPQTAKLLNEGDKFSGITRLRSWIQQFIHSQNLRHGGLLSALAVGIRDDISSTQWQVFRRTGTAHLVAISGLHIGMVAAMAYLIAQFLWRHSLLFRTQIPAPTVARFGALIAAASYAALAGFSLPTLRAFLMLLAYFLLLGLRRNPGILFSLGLVLLLVLLANPLAALGSGLWLSFTAVAAIAMVSSTANDGTVPDTAPTSRILRWLAQWWRVQLAVFIGLLPLSLLFFQQLSLSSLAANFLAIPLMTLLVVPLVLLSLLCLLMGLATPAGSLLSVADSLLSMLWPILQFMSDSDFSILVAPQPSAGVLLFSLISLSILLRARSRYRFIALAGLWPLLMPGHSTPAAGEFRVQLLDVGQGLSVLVQTRQHTLLYDAGIHYPDGLDAGRAMVIPTMRQLGIHQLDSIVISHNNLDHYGGADAVLEAYPAQQRYSSAGFFHNTQACERGIYWQWEGVDFEFLHPGVKNKEDDNNASCVLKISSDAGSILLSGDIEQQTETFLRLNTSEKIRNIDVLLLPHHGSRTSSSTEFIDTVKPQLAIVSAGYLNRFKHPHPKIVARYIARDVPIMNTASSGSITLTFGENGITAQAWREVYRRYWLEPIAGPIPRLQVLQPYPVNH